MFFWKKWVRKENKATNNTKSALFCVCCGHVMPKGSRFCTYCGVQLRTPDGNELNVAGTNAEEVSMVLSRYQEKQKEVLVHKATTIEKAQMDSEPYIFISYAHKDSEMVIPLLIKLKSHGFCIWFDENIEPASTWDDNIAEHIEKSEFFVSMISPNYLDSKNCLDELRYALSEKNKNKQFLLFLQDVVLPKGIAMRTGGIQNIYINDFETDDDMIMHFSKANGIHSCIQHDDVELDDTISVEERLILKFLSSDEKILRSMKPEEKTIKDGMDKDRIEDCLRSLANKQYIEYRFSTTTGNRFYQLTTKGINAVMEIHHGTNENSI